MTPKCKYWWSARRINIFLLSKVSRKKNTFPKLIYYPYTASRNRNYNILELYENYKNSFKTTATTRNKQTNKTKHNAYASILGILSAFLGTFVIFLRNFVRILEHFLEVCLWGHIIRETFCISKLNLGTISEICKLENTVRHFECRIVINEIG